MAAFDPLALAELGDGAWRTSRLVRFSHCDPAGIVYTAEYFNLFNEVVEDWFGEALGLPYHTIIGERRTGLGYAHAAADFARPARFGEVLEVAVLVKAIGRSSFRLALHAFVEGRECVRGDFTSVTTLLETHRPIPLPDDIRTALEAYRARCGGGPTLG